MLYANYSCIVDVHQNRPFHLSSCLSREVLIVLTYFGNFKYQRNLFIIAFTIQHEYIDTSNYARNTSEGLAKCLSVQVRKIRLYLRN